MSDLHRTGSGAHNAGDYTSREEQLEKGILKKAGDMRDTAAEYASGKAGQAAEKAGQARDYVAGKAGEAGETISTAAQAGGALGRAAVSDIGHGVGDAVESQTRNAAGAVESLAHSVGERANGLQETSPHLASTIKGAANAVENAARRAGESDLDDLARAVTDFGQKRPFTLLAVGVVGGLVLGRILNSSNRT